MQGFTCAVVRASVLIEFGALAEYSVSMRFAISFGSGFDSRRHDIPILSVR